MNESLHIYLRVSTETQITDGFGLDNQKDLGNKVSERMGLKPIIFDEGHSSSHLDTIDHRPKLRELLLKIEDGEVENLWVYSMDRLSRNDVVSFQIRQTLKKNKVRLYVGNSNDYNLDNPNDKLMFTIMEGFSEFDNSIRTERLRRGRLEKVRNGGWRGGPPPYGYQNKDGYLVSHSDEKRWVKKIYTEYSKGSSLYQIKHLLMKNGILSRRGNVVWSEQSILKILENTHYEGYHFYTDKKLEETIRCECPKILPSNLVKGVRKRLSDKKRTSNNNKFPTLLRSYLVCGQCGSKFGQLINEGQYKQHYFCRGNTERHRTEVDPSKKICVGDDGSRNRSLRIDDTDDIIWNCIINVLGSSHLFKEIFKKETLDNSKEIEINPIDVKLINKKIKIHQKQISQIDDVINTQKVNSLLDDSDQSQLKDFYKKLEDKRTQILSDIEDLKTQKYNDNQTKKWIHWVGQFKDKISNLQRGDLTMEERQSFLEGILQKIIVRTVDGQTHSLEIVFNKHYVNDGFEWIDTKVKSKGYNLFNGKKSLKTFLGVEYSNQKKTLKTVK
jgi:site-specific DNA recombinase